MWRSRDILNDHGSAVIRSLYSSMGFDRKDLMKPLIGIANSWSTVCPGSCNLRVIADEVKAGIYQAGGMPVEFGTIGGCDGIAAHKMGGMHYILPMRGIIADSIEMMVQAHWLDGIVLLASCDKIIPGMLMAATRLDLPAILVNSGPMLPGEIEGKNINTSQLQETEGVYRIIKKRGVLEELRSLETNACPTVGSCSQMATANTMACFAEALGLSLPWSSTIPAVYSDRLKVAKESGRIIVKLVKENITARKIINEKSLINALKVALAIGGSTNLALHWLAISYEDGLNFSIELIDKISSQTPLVASVLPSGKYYVKDFHFAGGIPAVVNSIKTLLNEDVISVTGKSIIENCKNAKILNKEIIHSIEEAFRKEGSLAVLKGNLAPEGSIAKPSAMPEKMLFFKGKAKVYNSENEAITALDKSLINSGDVVVIRYEGPKGGPGMQEMWKFMKILEGMGFGDSVGVITDGRFSGGNRGCFVCHICPEAAEKGPLSLVESGDTIVIDIPNRRLELEVSQSDLKQREKLLPPFSPKVKSGYLSTYAKLVQSASKGAIVQ